MTDDTPDHIDISNLPPRIRQTIEHHESVVDILRERVRQIALAAMVRDAASTVVTVALEMAFYQPRSVSRVVLEGIADPDLRNLVADRVWRVLPETGWQVAKLPEGQTRTWIMVTVRRIEVSAHEMATAARAVGL
jgi:DNA-binding GntR family transcriptional regulator